jgi:hydrogenase nickel incorporation protein HypB
MFKASNIMILNKIDLLPYVEFNVDKCIEYARQVNPEIQVFQMSATKGDGLSLWYEWLKSEISNKTQVP